MPANNLRDSVSPVAVVIAVVLLVAVVGIIAWRSLGGGSPGTVRVTPDQVRQSIANNHGRLGH